MKTPNQRVIAVFTLLEQKAGACLSRQQISDELDIPRKSVNDCLQFLRSKGVVEMIGTRPTPFYCIHSNPKDDLFIKEIEYLRSRLNAI